MSPTELEAVLAIHCDLKLWLTADDFGGLARALHTPPHFHPITWFLSCLAAPGVTASSVDGAVVEAGHVQFLVSGSCAPTVGDFSLIPAFRSPDLLSCPLRIAARSQLILPALAAHRLTCRWRASPPLLTGTNCCRLILMSLCSLLVPFHFCLCAVHTSRDLWSRLLLFNWLVTCPCAARLC